MSFLEDPCLQQPLLAVGASAVPGFGQVCRYYSMEAIRKVLDSPGDHQVSELRDVETAGYVL